jgi:hypothetical protein
MKFTIMPRTTSVRYRELIIPGNKLTKQCVQQLSKVIKGWQPFATYPGEKVINYAYDQMGFGSVTINMDFVAYTDNDILAEAIKNLMGHAGIAEHFKLTSIQNEVTNQMSCYDEECTFGHKFTI